MGGFVLYKILIIMQNFMRNDLWELKKGLDFFDDEWVLMVMVIVIKRNG